MEIQSSHLPMRCTENEKINSIKVENNQESEFGITSLHQCIVLQKNKLFKRLVEKNGDINSAQTTVFFFIYKGFCTANQ